MNKKAGLQPGPPAAPLWDGAQTVVLSLEGEFDLADRSRLLDAFALANGASLVVVDLAGVTYIDSTILVCLVTLHRDACRRDVGLVLTGLREGVERLFRICELDRLFDVRKKLGDVYLGEDGSVRRIALSARSLNGVIEADDETP